MNFPELVINKNNLFKFNNNELLILRNTQAVVFYTLAGDNPHRRGVLLLLLICFSDCVFLQRIWPLLPA